ncbi:DUF447 domain-containing protein [Halobacteriales archaeon QS_5_70_15]|nr:MAG: DUF447 domain-containing protein [Halobacteriales archaeon QS_5_70_15]
MSPGGWPEALDLRGVTESVVATLGPNDRWNLAALGLHVPEDGDDPVTARTWGRTRTRRNFAERGGGYVQFTRDPRTFVDAALSVRESDDPVVEDADAWVRVEVDRIGEGESGGTAWVDWALSPVESRVLRESVPTTNRGYYAVVEATVAASRLDVDAYDRQALLDRLRYFESVVGTAGGPAEREAFGRVRECVDDDW